MLILCTPVPVLYWELDFQNHGNQASFSGLGPQGAAVNKDVSDRCAEFTVVGWLIDQDRVADATKIISQLYLKDQIQNQISSHDKSTSPGPTLDTDLKTKEQITGS